MEYNINFKNNDNYKIIVEFEITVINSISDIFYIHILIFIWHVFHLSHFHYLLSHSNMEGLTTKHNKNKKVLLTLSKFASIGFPFSFKSKDTCYSVY